MTNKQTIKIYGTTWCGDCFRSKSFLEEKGVAHDYIDIEKDDSAMKFVLDQNNGMASTPTILFPDGSTLTEPTNLEISEKLEDLDYKPT